MKCEKCGEIDQFSHLSGGGGAEMWRCDNCGAVYNANPFGIEYVCAWEDYACSDMFPPPVNPPETERKIKESKLKKAIETPVGEDTMSKINCAVTVVLINDEKVGLIRRDKDDTLGGLLTAAGGKIEIEDGVPIEGVKYFPVEYAAIREVKEETGIVLTYDDLVYFCSLILPNNRVVMSFYAKTDEYSDKVVYLAEKEVVTSDELVPGMKTELLMMLHLLKERKEEKKRIMEYLI